MTRTTLEANLSTRTARGKLKHRTKPYFRLARGGASPVHLGYYRQADGRPGSWIARRYLGGQRYEMTTLGKADDDTRLPADGVSILDFDAAGRAALAWADAQAASVAAGKATAGAVTVRRAVDAYVAARKARDAKTGADTGIRMAHHVQDAPLAEVALSDLREEDLVRWREGLRRGGRLKRGALPSPITGGTVARILNDLRAALRSAAVRARLPADVLTVIAAGCIRPDDSTRARDKQVLPDADVRRLVEAAASHDPDFGSLVLAMAATGARMDQLARVRVVDFQADARRVMVPTSRKGRGTKAHPSIAVPLPDDVMAHLRTLIAGRAGHEPLLMRWHHRQKSGDKAAGRLPEWERTERRSWRLSSEITRGWHAILKATGLPSDLVPYCLRHSSIVRGLRAGLPVRLVAAVHDTSIAMIEKHYGAFIVDATEDLLRRAVLPLAPAPVALLRAIRKEA